ncbi:MAG: tyrosine-type recombinase/integrase [Actinomycetota bacterium]
MAKSKFPYLILDAGKWWYIRRPPKDLAHAFPPRIKRAFATGDQRIAEERWNDIHQAVEGEIRRAREQAEAETGPQIFNELSEDDAKALVTRAWWCWVHLRKPEATPIDAFPDFALAVLTKLPANAHLWSVNKLKGWFSDLAEHKVVAVFTPLAEAIIRREIPAHLPELAGAPIINMGHVKFFAATHDRALMLKELIERFEGDANRIELAEGTKGNYRPAFDALLGVLGPEINVRRISRADILKVRETLCWLPAYYNKGKRYQGMSLEKIVTRTKIERDAALARLEEAGIDDPSPEDLKAAGMPQFLKKTAINKYLGGIGHLFDWAVAEQIISSTPAARLKFNNVEESTKRSFSDDELLRLFPKNYELGPISWIPVMLLFHGLRPNEGCQLRTDDVVCDSRSQLWCLRIAVEPRHDPRISTKVADRTLKTAESKRVIPLHQRVIKLGFQQYVETRRAAGEKMLFEVKRYGKAGYYDSVRKAIVKIIADAGVYTRDTTVHSLRHTFAEALRNLAGAPQDMREAIGGWSVTGSSEIDYGAERYWPEKMKPWLDRIDWPKCFVEPAPPET